MVVQGRDGEVDRDIERYLKSSEFDAQEKIDDKSQEMELVDGASLSEYKKESVLGNLEMGVEGIEISR